MENKAKEKFEETQEKQAKLAKKIMLGIFGGMGILFAVLGIVFLCLADEFFGARELGTAFLPFGLAMAALGTLLYFVIPTKYNYEKYKARTEKYGMINLFDVNFKVSELEGKVAELEGKIAELEGKVKDLEEKNPEIERYRYRDDF